MVSLKPFVESASSTKLRIISSSSTINILESEFMVIVYENGNAILRFLILLLYCYEEVDITIQENSDIEGIARVAEESGAFEYLSDSGEDMYTITDGEPV